MKKILIIKAWFFLATTALATMAAPAWAVDYRNTYVFVDNQVDGEYWITQNRGLDPRFTGANRWSKYKVGEGQSSLGYIQHSMPGLGSRTYADYRLLSPNISQPFLGNRCRTSASGCPRTGIWAAEELREDGAYKVYQSSTTGESGNARPILSDSLYEYFRHKSVEDTTTLTTRGCVTSVNYDLSKGQTCESVNGRSRDDNFTVTKKAQVTLLSTNALQELFIDSNGIPSLGLGSQFCTVGTIPVNAINNVQGAICKLAAAETKGDIGTTMRIVLKLHESLNSNAIGARFIYFGDGNADWAEWKSTVRADRYFKPSNDGLYVFFTQTFLKYLVDNNIDLARSQDFFTFTFSNTASPQSGYYGFTPSNTILLRPRNYGISIVDKDLILNPTRQGKVGPKEPPLTFNYIVSTSGPRNADEITAKVTGPEYRRNGLNFCLFSSPDKQIQVPFSAYLGYTRANGTKVNARNSCGDAAIDFTDARWEATPWANAPHEGSFYRTQLDLTFPMNEGTSFFSITGDDWLGTVSAQGEVEVKATWRNVENDR